MKTKYYHKLFNIFVWTIMALIMIQIGMHFNFKVVEKNDCRMPVYNWPYVDTDKHFSYSDRNEINLWGLTDLIGIKGRFLISIGDIFLIGGSIIFIYMLLGAIILNKQFLKDEAKS